MAFYKRYKLPPLKLTQCGGAVSTKIIHRGLSSLNNATPEVVSSQSSLVQGHNILVCGEGNDPQSDLMEPTSHELEKKASVKGWEKLRAKIIEVSTECSAMPLGQICLVCPRPAEFRCQKCGPHVFYCKSCLTIAHQRTNFFHVPEKWENDHFVVAQFEDRLIDVLHPHECSSVKAIPLCVLDEHGVEHNIQFSHCDCEPLPLTLVRARLWPATPQYPRYAFTFNLLDWAEALLLECHVALKEFCNALYFRCPYSVTERRNVYSSIIDAFEEYRFYKHEIRHLTYLSTELDSGNVCPACPKIGGKTVLSIDGLFGLPRKKSAGSSCRNAVNGSLFFCDQSNVDQFVRESCAVKGINVDCNNFLAGSMLRSATRYRALDETAVFGAACRHEFPLLFLNLKHGEKLSYAVYLIEAILQRRGSTDLYIMYDIACTLQKHLKLTGRDDLLQEIKLCLPSFHSYGHKASCQIQFGPMRCDGIGMSDGEVMERLWSYLRCFSKMTKEMRPAHRIDVLTHGLVYYGIRKKDKLCRLLTSRWKKAYNMKMMAENVFSELTNSSNGISEDTAKQWLSEELALATNDVSSINPLPSWKCEYFQALHSYYLLREKLPQDSTDQEKLSNYHEIIQLDKQLSRLEEKNHIHTRWDASAKEYKEVQLAFSLQKKEQLSAAIWAASRRRQFLLKLKAKYADGQKIAKKLCIQISKETKRMKLLIPDYNVCLTIRGEATITLQDALDPLTLSQMLHSTSYHPSKPKQEVIDAYLMMKRTTEEISMLRDDMCNTTQYYHDVKNAVEKALLSFSTKEDAFSRGAVSLLQTMKRRIDRMTRSFPVFNSCMDSSVVPQHDSDLESDTESASDTDDDNDDDDDDL